MACGAGGLRGSSGALWLGLLTCFTLGCPGVEPTATGSGAAGGGDGGRPATTSTGGFDDGGGGDTSTGGHMGGMNVGGCSPDLSSDVEHCGECDRPCVDDDSVAVAQCKAGVCVSFCESGFVNMTMPETGPDDGCETPGRRVFVTEEAMTVGQLGGVAQADDRCQQLAVLHKLGGTWAAWLSDDTNTSPPEQRFNREPAAPYMLLNFTPVADSWEALVGDALLHQIDLTELQMPAASPGVAVWTGTSPLGQATAGHCTAWTNVDGQATVGDLTQLGPEWTQQEAPSSCGETARLYCFEQ